MARELFLDPFVGMKDFYQSTESFDPHKLPLMSSVWPTFSIACIYLVILRMSPKWVLKLRYLQLINITEISPSQINEASTAISTTNISRHLQYFSSSLVSLLPRQHLSYGIRVEISLAVSHARIWEPRSREATLLLLYSQGHRANRNGLLRVEEEVPANVVPSYLSPRIDFHLHLFRRDTSWKWVTE